MNRVTIPDYEKCGAEPSAWMVRKPFLGQGMKMAAPHLPVPGGASLKEMGGSLTAFRDGQACGAQFVLELPIANCSSRAHHSASAHKSPFGFDYPVEAR